MLMSRLFRSVILKVDSVPLSVFTSRPASHDLRRWNQNHAFGPRHSQKQRTNDNGLDPDDVESQIEEVIREEKRKQKTVKFHKIKRQLRPKGAPERKLTWDAIEQIRFLKHESPEEWTVGRLAEGFSVTPDEISRILRSKFTPAPEQRVRQDHTVLAKQQQPTLADGTGNVQRPKTLPTPSSSTQITLPEQERYLGLEEGPVVHPPQKRLPAAPSTRMKLAKVQQQQPSLEDITLAQPSKKLSTTPSTQNTLPVGPTGALGGSTSQSQVVVTAAAKGKITHVGKGSSVDSLRPSPQSTALRTGSVMSTVPLHHKNASVKMAEKMAELKFEEGSYSEDGGEEAWDGVTLTESELQQLSQTVTEKTPLVVKSGREYFDSDGNFLYRV